MPLPIGISYELCDCVIFRYAMRLIGFVFTPPLYLCSSLATNRNENDCVLLPIWLIHHNETMQVPFEIATSSVGRMKIKGINGIWSPQQLIFSCHMHLCLTTFNLVNLFKLTITWNGECLRNLHANYS